MNRRLVVVLGVALLAVVGVYAWVLMNDAPTPAGTQEEAARTRFTSPHFVGYHRGVRQWSLRAEVIEEDALRAPGVLHLTGITEGVLYKDGSAHLRFHAERGVWRQERGDLELEGDVRFYELEKELLSAERVFWYGADERLVAPERVTLYHSDQRVEADSLEALLAEDTVRLSGNVEWTTDSGVRVRASHAVYSGNELQFSELLEPIRFVP